MREWQCIFYYYDPGYESTTSNSGGAYSLTVSEGWSGDFKTTYKYGYYFTPSYITYNNIAADQTGQDYTATSTSYPDGRKSLQERADRVSHPRRSRTW